MIYIDNRQSSIEVTKELEETICKIIDYTLRAEELSIGYEVSIVFVSNDEIKEINKLHRNIEKETDVLSFPMLEYPKSKVFKEVYPDNKFTDDYFDQGNLVLGDMILSLEKALEQSKEYEHTFLRETAYLTVHSMLHLLGYDHIEEEDKNKMRKREEEILNQFHIMR